MLQILKKILWYISIRDFGPQSSQNPPLSPKDEFLGIPASYFYLVIVPYHATKFEKKS